LAFGQTVHVLLSRQSNQKEHKDKDDQTKGKANNQQVIFIAAPIFVHGAVTSKSLMLFCPKM
jgi:hypothetical protein